jgi:uncharacterized protein YbjQ (UPF0145 family)
VAVTCARCGAKQGFLGVLNTDITGGKPYYCMDCEYKVSQEKEQAEAEARARRAQLHREAKAKATTVILTSTHRIDGHRVVSYLGIESVEIVIGTGVFSEFTGEIADFFGRRSTAFETKLAKAKEFAMEALKLKAAEKGANAVVGIDMDYTEFSGNRIALIVNGTLVAIAPITASGHQTRT